MKSQRSFYLPPSNLKLILALVIAASFTFVSSRATAANLPTGFTEAQVGGNLSGSPTAMAFAPDGRLFVCQQGGQLRVIKNGSLLSTPFVTLTVDSSGERGLLGIAFDPNFATNN
jgi:glucose/arabinose dehydrogenase